MRPRKFVRAVEPRGGCLCNSIAYRITGAPAQSLCHCRSCRLASGVPSVAWIVVKCSDLAFVTGDPVRFRSSPPRRQNSLWEMRYAINVSTQ